MISQSSSSKYFSIASGYRATVASYAGALITTTESWLTTPRVQLTLDREAPEAGRRRFRILNGGSILKKIR